MEGVSILKDLLERNELAISFDLKEAYNHVPVHHSMKNLLGTCWRGEAYRFVGMPFGLNDAPRAFTKIMKFVVRTIREIWNIKVVIYLDYILILHQDKDHLEQVGQEVLQFLQWLGWTVNVEKSQLVPAQIFWYLVWEWNSVDMEVMLTEERIEKI
jgi:hypothetical protein